MGLTKYILENSKKIVIPYNSAPFFLFVGSSLSLSLSLSLSRSQSAKYQNFVNLKALEYTGFDILVSHPSV